MGIHTLGTFERASWSKAPRKVATKSANSSTPLLGDGRIEPRILRDEDEEVRPVPARPPPRVVDEVEEPRDQREEHPAGHPAHVDDQVGIRLDLLEPGEDV